MLVGPAWGPSIVYGIGHNPGLPLRGQLHSYSLAKPGHALPDDWIDIWVVGVDKRGQHQARPIRILLVLIKDNMWAPKVMKFFDS